MISLLFGILLMSSQEGGKGSGFETMIPLLLIIVVFYFFMIRPQMKKAKDQKKFRAALQKGDKIITIGGIHGKIVEVQETSFTIEVEGGMKLRIEKSAVSMNGAMMDPKQ